MEKKLTDLLFSNYDSFFDAEKRIADYIFQNSEKVVEMTIAELAKMSGTSDATVSRFCKKCNLKGFHHLKISLAKELSDNKPNVTITNDISRKNIGQSLENILANKMEEITQTIHRIDAEMLNTVLEIFCQAECVQFAAVGNTLPVALDGAYKFNQVGIKAVAFPIWETQLAYAMNAGSKDVFVIISNSGASRQLIKLAEIAKEKNAVIIGITNSDHSPLAIASDFHFTTATRERLLLEEYYFSRISAMTLIEIFFLMFAGSDENAKRAIQNHEALIADDKL